MNLRSKVLYRCTTRYDASDPDQASSVNSWQPIPELSVVDADVSVFFLEMNNVRYSTPVTDLWFAAELGPINATSAYRNISSQFYQSDEPVRTLACVQ